MGTGRLKAKGTVGKDCSLLAIVALCVGIRINNLKPLYVLIGIN